jgi:uncharacterized protein YegL
MKKRKTIYHLIVDESESMNDCIESTINGINEQINKIKSLQNDFIDEEITIGLTTFNDNVKHHFFQSIPSETKLIDFTFYEPDGATALFDAIGTTVKIIENEVNLENKLLQSTLVIVLLTDGYENASKFYNLETIRSNISRLEKTGRWVFSFIGATIDAVIIANDMAIKPHNSFNFDKSEMNSMVWKKLSNSMAAYFEKKSMGKNTSNLFDI